MFQRARPLTNTEKLIKDGKATVSAVIECDDFTRAARDSEVITQYFTDKPGERLGEFLQLLLDSKDKKLGTTILELWKLVGTRENAFRHIFVTYADMFFLALSKFGDEKTAQSLFLNGIIWELLSRELSWRPNPCLNILFHRPRVLSRLLKGLTHPAAVYCICPSDSLDQIKGDMYLWQYLVWNLMCCLVGKGRLDPLPGSDPKDVEYPEITDPGVRMSIVKVIANFLMTYEYDWSLRPLWTVLRKFFSQELSKEYLLIAARIPPTKGMIQAVQYRFNSMFDGNVLKPNNQRSVVDTLQLLSCAVAHLSDASIINILVLIFCRHENLTNQIILEAKKVLFRGLEKKRELVSTLIEFFPFLWTDVANAADSPMKEVTIAALIDIASSPSITLPGTPPWDNFKKTVVDKWAREEEFVATFDFGRLTGDEKTRDKYRSMVSRLKLVA